MHLEYLPMELLRHVFRYLRPSELLHLQSVSRYLFEAGTDNLLWLYYCKNDFKYWNHPGELSEAVSKFGGPKCVYERRYKLDRHITKRFQDLLGTQVGRLAAMHEIAMAGICAKDTLLCILDAEDLESVLSRR